MSADDLTLPERATSALNDLIEDRAKGWAAYEREYRARVAAEIEARDAREKLAAAEKRADRRRARTGPGIEAPG